MIHVDFKDQSNILIRVKTHEGKVVLIFQIENAVLLDLNYRQPEFHMMFITAFEYIGV